MPINYHQHMKTGYTTLYNDQNMQMLIAGLGFYHLIPEELLFPRFIHLRLTYWNITALQLSALTIRMFFSRHGTHTICPAQRRDVVAGPCMQNPSSFMSDLKPKLPPVSHIMQINISLADEDDKRGE